MKNRNTCTTSATYDPNNVCACGYAGTSKSIGFDYATTTAAYTPSTASSCCQTVRDFNMAASKKYSFAGGFNKIDDTGSVESFYIKKVLYKAPVTVVFWSDGTKTVAKIHGGDVYNPESGLTICVLKKLCGTSHVRSLLKAWVGEDAYKANCLVTASEARKAAKN